VKPIIFLIPIVAILISIILYIFLLKKADDKKIFKRYVLIMAVISFILNEVWELIQMPLYSSAYYNVEHIVFCTLGALADTIMVLLLYFSFAFIYKNIFWIWQTNWFKIFVVMVTGAVGAVLSEKRHLLLGSWAYDQSMPIVPVVNVGLSPMLQFFLLPVIIYYLSYFINSKFYNQTILHHTNHH
jgi:hypothetical protein